MNIKMQLTTTTSRLEMHSSMNAQTHLRKILGSTAVDLIATQHAVPSFGWRQNNNTPNVIG